MNKLEVKFYNTIDSCDMMGVMDLNLASKSCVKITEEFAKDFSEWVNFNFYPVFNKETTKIEGYCLSSLSKLKLEAEYPFQIFELMNEYEKIS